MLECVQMKWHSINYSLRQSISHPLQTVGHPQQLAIIVITQKGIYTDYSPLRALRPLFYILFLNIKQYRSLSRPTQTSQVSAHNPID
jgi:hypothetical protein